MRCVRQITGRGLLLVLVLLGLVLAPVLGHTCGPRAASTNASAWHGDAGCSAVPVPPHACPGCSALSASVLAPAPSSPALFPVPRLPRALAAIPLAPLLAGTTPPNRGPPHS